MSKLHILNGPEIGRSFNLRDGASFIGRSLDNDVRIDDRTVSRKHLRIVKRRDTYVITDLKSQNGTFLKGKFIKPGVEVEVEEGVPIAIGITVICLGEECEEQMMPFLDSAEFAKQSSELNETLVEHRKSLTLKRLEFLHKVSSVLMEDLNIRETLEKILQAIFEQFKRIDRSVFILVDPETGEPKETIYKSNESSDVATTAYCQDIATRVIIGGKPVVVSDVRTEETEFADTLKVLQIESVMCVPLVSRSQILGAIYIDSLKRPYGFRREDVLLFMNLGQRIASAIEDAWFASEILKAADALSPER